VWSPPFNAHQKDRSAWAWLPGPILSRCAPGERHVVVDVPALAELAPDTPHGDALDNPLDPTCIRDARELRPIMDEQWQHARKEPTRG
jgi:hypothetical protein